MKRVKTFMSHTSRGRQRLSGRQGVNQHPLMSLKLPGFAGASTHRQAHLGAKEWCNSTRAVQGLKGMHQVEYWRWRYRDPETGRVCRTIFQLTAEEAAKYPDAERIPGTMLLRDVEDSSFGETAPGAFRRQPG